MSHPQLQAAFEQLMVRAPSALFKRARRLYLDKYPLDGRDCSSALRLFVAEERVEEWVEPDPEAAPLGKIAVVTIRPTRLSLVHWQQSEPASEQMCSDYLQNTWGLDPSGFKAISDPWFRNGGQQKQAQAPDGLIWTRRSTFTAEAPSTAANE
ncbi:MAG: hypothetical protein GKR83_03540 [Synechococcus sp. s2_metabat2_7]|nr:hypothetical protein [Synechococcus sp. s2_metabat2_7]